MGKTYPDFPLTAAPSGRWCKEHTGFNGKPQYYYFGPLDDWQSALERFTREWPGITQGKPVPPEDSDTGCTLQVLCNAFHDSNRSAMEAGELDRRLQR